MSSKKTRKSSQRGSIVTPAYSGFVATRLRIDSHVL